MKAISKASPADLILLVGIAAVWASAFIAIKIAVPEVGPLWLAAIRVGIGALVLAPYAIVKGLIFPSTRQTWVLVIVMASLNVVIPFYLISWAEQTVDAGVVALLMGLGPFLALLGSHYFTDDDKINARKMIGVAFGFAGVLVVVGGAALNQLGGQHIMGQLAAIGGSLCYVAAGILIRRIDIAPSRLAFLALAIGTLILIPAATLVDGLPTQMPSSSVSFALLYLGIFPTGIAYILRFYLIRKVGYSTFSMSVNMIPVFGVFLGYLILNEALNAQILLALALVLVGLYFMNSGQPKDDKAVQKPLAKQ